MPRALLRLLLAIPLLGTVMTSAAPPDSEAPVSLSAEPRWFKGNLHTHTLWSDGNDYPEMVVDWYTRHGYQFLALSDHNVLGQGTKWMSVAEADKRAKQDGFARYRERFGESWVETRTEKDVPQVRLKPLGEYRTLFEKPGHFLLIPGEEITDHFEQKPIHMNASNLAELIKPQGGKSVTETMANNLAAVEEQGKRLGRPILTHLNHPNFGYAITAEELAMVTKERFFEVYNGHPDVHHQGDEAHSGVERIWDIINTIRIGEMKAGPVAGLATDDSHHYFGKEGATSGRGWVMVRSRFLTPESIIKGIETGDFHASSGVTLKDVRYSPKSRTLDLEIEPQGNAHYSTTFIGTLKGYDPTRKPVTDKQGKPLPVTKRYSDDVGKVLATVEGTNATYTLTGQELFVRAVVTSDQAPENPSFEGQKAQAWTQPVGWEKWVASVDSNGHSAFPGKVSRWEGFVRHDFQVDGADVIVVEPETPLPGRPWAWRGEFFGAFANADIALVKAGWHLAYMGVPDQFGSPKAIAKWEKLYDVLVYDHKLSPKPGLIGLSRGALYCMAWAAARPDQTLLVYLDNGVCDFKSWPGGKPKGLGTGNGSPPEWLKLLKAYDFKNDEEAIASKVNPVDRLEPLAKAKLPIFLVYGDSDRVVPHQENSEVIFDRYKALGGPVERIVKPGQDHHPHGLTDPTPVVEFFEKVRKGR